MSYHKRWDVHKDLTSVEYDAMCELIRDLGHDPNLLGANFAITVNADGVCLHLSNQLLDEDGSWIHDLAADQPATCPCVHRIDLARLPATLRPAVEAAGQ